MNNNIDDIIIGRDFKQSITSNEIKKFYNDIKFKDIHRTLNLVDMGKLDNANVNGKRPIDSIAVSVGLMPCIEGYKLLNNNDILYSNHR